MLLAVEERDELLAVRLLLEVSCCRGVVAFVGVLEDDGDAADSLLDRPTARRRGVGGRSKMLEAAAMADDNCPPPPPPGEEGVKAVIVLDLE